jgi:hypothetical protein
MTLRSFREVFCGATHNSFNPVRTISIILAAAIVIAGTAVAQTVTVDESSKKNNQFSARLSGFNEVHLMSSRLLIRC